MRSPGADDAHGKAATTEDGGRYILVNGRRWRATDPSIPAAFRSEVVHELMDARRAVGKLTRAADDPAPARARVQDAKVALGERGEPWWTTPTDDGRRQRIEATIRALLRARVPDSSICPSDVARTIGAGSWRPLVPMVREVASDLAATGVILVTQRDEVVDVRSARGPVRLRRGPGMSGRGDESSA